MSTRCSPWLGAKQLEENLDRRALAGLVVAQQVVHRAARQAQRHAAERDHAEESC